MFHFLQVEVNFMDDVGQTLLNWASAFGTQEMVEFLCAKGNIFKFKTQPVLLLIMSIFCCKFHLRHGWLLLKHSFLTVVLVCIGRVSLVVCLCPRCWCKQRAAKQQPSLRGLFRPSSHRQGIVDCFHHFVLSETSHWHFYSKKYPYLPVDTGTVTIFVCFFP